MMNTRMGALAAIAAMSGMGGAVDPIYGNRSLRSATSTRAQSPTYSGRRLPDDPHTPARGLNLREYRIVTVEDFDLYGRANHPFTLLADEDYLCPKDDPFPVHELGRFTARNAKAAMRQWRSIRP